MVTRLFTILFILTWELRHPQKRGVNRKRLVVLKVVLPGRGQMAYLGEGRKVLPGVPGVGENYAD